MRFMLKSTLVALGITALAAAVTAPARAQESSFGPADAKETYYWISNKANLPLFVQYDYVGMKKIAEELGVKVVVAGPTDFDLPGFIAAVDQVCAQKPNGVSVVLS
ncbi:MAG: sugar ABC transporter substrate-binding protein, partial [Mesorhizobium sp.]